MIIKKKEAASIKANEGSTIWDYPIPTEHTGVSSQTLNGRLPVKGWYKNTVCREIFYIIGGKATINIDGEVSQVEAGDVVVLEPNQKHYGEYENVSLITITTPNWYEDQCKIEE